MNRKPAYTVELWQAGKELARHDYSTMATARREAQTWLDMDSRNGTVLEHVAYNGVRVRLETRGTLPLSEHKKMGNSITFADEIKRETATGVVAAFDAVSAHKSS